MNTFSKKVLKLVAIIEAALLFYIIDNLSEFWNVYVFPASGCTLSLWHSIAFMAYGVAFQRVNRIYKV